MPVATRSLDWDFGAGASAGARPAGADAWVQGISMLAAGLALIAASVCAHLLGGQILGIVVCAALSTLLAIYRPEMAPIALIVGFLFQNLFVSWVSPFIDPADFNAIRAYNFLIAVCVWGVCAGGYLLEATSFPRRPGLLIAASLAALMIVAVYFAIGLAANSQSAIVYLRNIGLAIMLTQIGLIIGYRRSPNIEPALQLTAYLVLAMGFFEFFARDAWLDLTNGSAYWLLNTQPARDSGALVKAMMVTGDAFVDIKDFFLTDFLNTNLLSDLQLRVYRLNGPNMHSISFSYALAFLMLVMVAHRRYLYVAMAIPLLLLVSAKGATVMFVLTTIAVVVARIWPRRLVMAGFVLVLAGYLAFAIENGLGSGDYHVLGFLGGVNGFFKNPLGRGVGSGGNLSVDFGNLDWSAAQHSGELDVAAESAVGVLLYQLGVAAFFVLGVYVFVARAAWGGFLRSRLPVHAVCAFGMLVTLANGVLQEEALFSPLALSLITLYASLKLGMLARAEAA